MFALVLLLGMVQDSSSIRGVVRAQHSHEPIARATVSLPALNRSVSSDVNGAFQITRVPAGRWRVDARALGYESHSLTVASAGLGVLNLDFELAIRPLRIGGVTVNMQRPGSGGATAPLDPAGPPPMRLVAPDELKQLPGLAEPDVLRALQFLPAVSAISDYSSAPYVRGGASDQSVVTLDGVPVFNPYHLGGLFGAINPDAVGTVDVWAGALPANSPDRLSSVVQLQPRSGSRERMNAHGNIGLISSQLTLDGPLSNRRGSYLVSGRNTYLDVLTGLAYRMNLIDLTMPYGFSDLFARVEHDLGRLGAITWSGYFGGEKIGVPPRMARELESDLDFGWGSRMSTVALRHPVGTNLLAQARLAYSDFHGSIDDRNWTSPVTCGECTFPPDTTHSIEGASLARVLIGELDLNWYARSHQLHAGLAWNRWTLRHRIDFNSDHRLINDLNWRQQAGTIAAYLEDEWAVSDRLQLRAGLRLVDAGSAGRAWLPRAGVRLQVHDDWALSLGAGRYAQLLRGMRDEESAVSSVMATELYALQPDSVGMATADDLVLGLQWQRARASLRIDAYTRRMHNLMLAPSNPDPLERPFLIEREYRLGTGSARGLELMARHAPGNLELGLNYAFTNALRSVDTDEFTPRFERRHTIDLTAAYRRAGGSILSARLAMGSGQPYTPVVDVVPTWSYDADGRVITDGHAFIPGEHNSARLPGYLRLDVAARKNLRKRWFGRETTVTPYVQILNLLNSKNVMLTDPAPNTRPRPELRYWPQLPILPTFGLEWKF
jgi:hypothetical protein